MKKRTVRLIIPVMLAGILTGIVLCRALHVTNSTEDASLSDDGISILTEGISNITVVDDASACEAVRDGGRALGLKNALAEPQIIKTDHVGENTFYRAQSYYHGIPVFGRYTSLICDENGEAVGLISDSQDISEEITLSPAVSEETICIKLREYLIGHGIPFEDPIVISTLNQDDLIIFPSEDGTSARLAYRVVSESAAQYVFYADALDGSVLGQEELMLSSTYVGMLETNHSITAPVVYMEELQAYMVFDSERRIGIFSFDKKNSQKKYEEKYITSSDDLIFGNTAGERELEPEKAFAFLDTIGRIRDWYYDTFGQGTPFGMMRIGYNDSYYKGNNSLGGVYDNHSASVINIGYNIDPSEIGTLTHEYAHCIQFDHWAACDGKTKDIQEGLADVFGMFYTDDWDLDAQTFGRDFHRNAVVPKTAHYPESYHDRLLFFPETEGHQWATVYSHMAYTMLRSGAFEKNELMHLWYDTMISLPYHSNTAVFRRIMEYMAGLSGFSDEQMLVLTNALDAAGIDSDSVLACGNNLAITSFDLHGNIYDDYTVSLAGQKSNYFHEQVSISLKPDDAGKTKIHLDDGMYTIVVRDNGGDYEESQSIVVSSLNNSQKDKGDTWDLFFFGFGADYTVAPDAVLSVFDCNGEPLDGYITSVFSKDHDEALLPDNILHLPENNYYTFMISHPEGETASCEFFTVRIKEGAADSLAYNCYHIRNNPVETEKVPESEPASEAISEENLPLVSDAFSYLSPQADITGFYCYHIPQINLPGGIANELNKEIYEKLYGLLTEYHIIDGEKSDDFLWLKYRYGEHADYASLIIWSRFEKDHGVRHEEEDEIELVYFSKATGKRITKDELLASYGLTEQEYREHIIEILQSLDISYLDFISQVNFDYRQEFRDCLPYGSYHPYISVDGELCVAWYVYGNSDWASYGTLNYLHPNLDKYELFYPTCIHDEGVGSVETPTSVSEQSVPVVTDAFCYTRPGIYSPFEQPYCYHIPQINIPGETAERLNKEIYEKWYSYLEKWNCFDEYSGIIFLNYSVGTMESVGSILLTHSLGIHPFREYSIVNFSTVTGERLSKQEVLSAFQMDEAQMKQIVSDRLRYIFSVGSYWDAEKGLQDSLSDQNLNDSTPFINKDGDLCVCFYVYTYVDNGVQPTVLNLSTMEGEPFTPCPVHSASTEGETQLDVPEESKPELSSPPLAEITPDENDPDAARFLAMIMEQTARDSVKYLCCYDYDGDGQKEAFAVVANSVQSSPEGEQAEVWFASDYEVTRLLDNMYYCTFIKSVAIGNRVLFTASENAGGPGSRGYTYSVTSGHPDKVGNSANLLIMDYNGESLLFSEGTDTDGEHGVGRYVYYYHETWDEQQYALVKESGVYYKASTGELVYFQSPTHLKMALRENRV